MPVCQFFLEGRCRYGERCRNEHPRGGVQRNLFGGGGGERKITFRDNFTTAGQYKWSSSNQQNQATSQSSLDIVSNLPKEMETFESSKMWPLTCIGLEGYTNSLPDFVDTSFEELRLAAYQALKENNFKTFADKYHQQLEEVKTKRDYLKHLTMETKAKLISFLDAARTQQSQGPETHGSEMNTSSLFNQQKSNSALNSLSLFSQASPGTGSNSNVDLFSTPKSLFSSQFAHFKTRGGDVGSSVFGSSTAASHSLDSTISFGKPATSSSVTNTPAMTLFGIKSLFGEDNKATTNQNIFSQSSSIFGGNVASTSGGNAASIFGSNAASTFGGNAASTFGSNAASKSGGNAASIFGSNAASTFGGNAASTFGGNPASTFGSNAASIFGGNAASTFGASTFGGNAASTFGGNAASTFGGNAASAFGGNTASTVGGNTASTFGGNRTIGGFVSSQTSTQSSPVAQASGIYSKLTDLNDQEKEAFMAKSFQLGHIPLCPPPVELIN